MSTSDRMALAFSRFGYGARPGDLAQTRTNPRERLLAEIERRNAALLQAPALPSTRDAYAAVREDQMERSEAKADGAPKPERAGPQVPQAILQDEIAARLARIRAADMGFAERLVAFWTNHFCIEAKAGGPVRGMAGAYEREAIRPHVLGKFEDLLVAATRHPAMLIYLNNASSIGPDSRAGERRNKGLNENHAREIMELHTLGVTGGYDQADVIALAKILTGWTIGYSPDNDERYGRYWFNANAHEPGAQTLLGMRYDQPGEQQGLSALADLARRPATARHVADKLARHFVSDRPPQALVERLADTFLKTGGDLLAVAVVLVSDEEAWTAPAAKIRTPQEFVWSAARAIDPDLPPPFLGRTLAALGQPLWDPPAPAGFKDDAATWLAPDAMTTRVEIAERLASRASLIDPRDLAEAVLGARLSEATRQTIARAESPAQGAALMLMSPEFQRR
ncbi:DUF1800 domain-containing protein [Mangrovibrevibacter kandeliae]|uniref:DUF1800 domain-containing protein n=1 Tax=Mangrovibrevibacter kandeliae TaxID=2968473 RepID=UPI002117E4AB|nr:DUF1800 domain-containing protein [Aurantimonas sp. CSK15Z-1]MCQ8783709.1 DUF1800 domain-containing protein [Aurantimonas sp. CSK15Z-1]